MKQPLTALVFAGLLLAAAAFTFLPRLPETAALLTGKD